MSEQDSPSDGAADRMSPVVVVETASSKRSVPFKPTELQDVGPPDLHQKRAPAVAAVPENLKGSTEISVNKEQKGSEIGMTSERHKHVAKKLSSNASSNKRESTPKVAIPMTPIEVESKKSCTITAAPTSTTAMPIPDTHTRKDTLDEKADVVSITSDITELRSPEADRKSKEWLDEEEAGGLPRSESRTSRTSRMTRAVRELFCCGVQLEAPSEDNVSSPREAKIFQENDKDTLECNLQEEVEDPVPLQRKLGNETLNASFIINNEKPIEPSTSSDFKKKEITWSDETYLEKVQLQDLRVRSTSWMLERKTSVGPCYRRGMPLSGPSGITICLPKKPSTKMDFIPDDCTTVKSGISITVSKRCFDNTSKPHKPFESEVKRAEVESTVKLESDIGLKIKQDSYFNYCANLRGKLDNLCGRIKHALHI